MKPILTVVLALVTFGATAQQKSEVFEFADRQKADLYAKSLEWVAKTWKSANDVVQMKDQESGVIVVKGGLASAPKNLGIPVKGMTHTTVTIRIKDGKAKVEFNETYFRHDFGKVDWEDKSTNSGQYKKWKEATSAEIDGLLKSYQLEVSKSVDDF